MVYIVLQEIADQIDFDSLPPEWISFDIRRFSRTKVLYDYQEEALKNALKILWLYFGKFNQSKAKLLEEYVSFGVDPEIFSFKKSKKFSILKEFHEFQEALSENWVNRMCFWMATGSGKTVILVKLVEILALLMERGCIPRRDILILTHREDLIGQIKKHIDEFNQDNEIKIKYWSLKEYFRVKRCALDGNLINIFVYRADLLSDEEKENLVDFRNYECNGNWYVLLDEAHKGDKEESKRQLYYHIISRNGFLFNFSATFMDPIDICSTVYNFNLEQFVTRGYGKSIFIFKEGLEAFKNEFSSNEKRKIVLKTLVLLTYLNKVFREIRKSGHYYHKPLILVFVNTVNPTQDNFGEPDLVRFFNGLETIVSGKDSKIEEAIQMVKRELVSELEDGKYVFSDESLQIDGELLRSTTYEEILENVFNTTTPGRIEVLISQNRKELVFKMKTSDKPFALIRIGDITKLLKERFKGYDVVEKWKNESYFERLCEDDLINIVMGSRAFYEGWDLNRPNIILFINIGVGELARKFTLQAIGRGVRIEPVRGIKRRAKFLDRTLGLNPKHVSSIETLFVFGTKIKVLREIVESLKKEKLHGKPFIKRYSKRQLVKQPMLTVSRESRKIIRRYLDWLNDDRVLLMLYSSYFRNLEDLQRFKEFVNLDLHVSDSDVTVDWKSLISRIAMISARKIDPLS